MSVQLTEKAIKELTKIIAEQTMPEGTMVRASVSGGGCSGFMYSLGFEEAQNVDEKIDKIIDQEGLKLVVDKKSLLYMEGTTIDFHEDLNKRGFVFENPSATKTCGCGSSFQA